MVCIKCNRNKADVLWPTFTCGSCRPTGSNDEPGTPPPPKKPKTSRKPKAGATA
jgi:hypothetical protein